MFDDLQRQIDIDLFQNLPPLPAVGMHLADVDFSANLKFHLEGELHEIATSDLHTTWAHLFMPVHGTTVDRALQIIQDGSIFAHSAIGTQHPDIQQARISNATDALDIEIGMNKFVFASIGRVNPFDIQEAYFCFSSALGEKEGAFVALREIVHFGALVSPEAARWKALALAPAFLDVAARNQQATADFLQNVFRYADFRNEVFPRFLARNFGDNLGMYCTDLLYPGTDPEILKVGNEAIISNAWDGPQLCIPERVEINDLNPSLLVTTEDPRALNRIKQSGFPAKRIYTITEALETYEGQFKFDFSSQRDAYAVINLALRDLALIGQNNTFGETFKDSMNGFKHRA